MVKNYKWAVFVLPISILLVFCGLFLILNFIQVNKQGANTPSELATLYNKGIVDANIITLVDLSCTEFQTADKNSQYLTEKVTSIRNTYSGADFSQSIMEVRDRDIIITNIKNISGDKQTLKLSFGGTFMSYWSFLPESIYTKIPFYQKFGKYGWCVTY
jgi:hypothetical protein